jgi:hypothetical protein
MAITTSYELTDDETWISFMNVETKEQPKQWMHTYSPKSLSTRKLMATVFWDRKGVLQVEFMQEGTIIMSEVYFEPLKTA